MENGDFDARYNAWIADFERFRKNRESVPLQELQTRYARSYKDLCKRIVSGADWFARSYIMDLIGDFPSASPKDAEEIGARIADQLKADQARGGLRDQALAALIEKVDFNAFLDALYRRYHRIETEIFLPYFRRYCRPAVDGTIYNDLIRCWWRTPPELPEGAWYQADGSVFRFDWPPA